MNLKTFVFKIFRIVGSILILIGLVLIISKILFIDQANSAVGTVTDIIQRKTQDSNDVIYSTQVQFQTTDGIVRTFTSGIKGSSPLYAVGSTVKVIYDPQNPQNAEINAFLTMWFLQTFLIFMGMFFLALSLSGLSKLRSGKPLGVTYSIQLSGKEMGYLFFKKKICPNCSGKLVRLKEYEDIGIGISEGIDSFTYGQQYTVNYLYKCNYCGEIFTIKQLAKN